MSDWGMIFSLFQSRLPVRSYLAEAIQSDTTFQLQLKPVEFLYLQSKYKKLFTSQNKSSRQQKNWLNAEMLEIEKVCIL